jgi:2,4-diaminopentanoate dehydrogenase
MSDRPFRVVQWATGGVGVWSLRQIIDHPDLELAGCLVYTDDKHGKDAGELCGRPATGVLATMSKQEIYDLDADVVLWCPKLPDNDDLLAILSSGKNVITPLSFFSPIVEGPELMARVGEAGRVGNSSVLAAGIDPGFVCDRVPAVLTGICSDVSAIRMEEVFDCSRHPLADMMFNLLGFGKGPEDIHLDSPGGIFFSQHLFPAVLDKLARALGVQLDNIEMGNVEFAFATKDFEIAAGEVKKGKIAGLSFDYTGTVGGKPFLTQRWVHHVGQHLGALPEGWRMAPDPQDLGLPAVADGGYPVYEIVLNIDGRPSLHNRTYITDPEDPVWQGTANALIRVIPAVCAAPAGWFEEPVFGAWREHLDQPKTVSSVSHH